jgi:hypothetical protein
MRCSRRQTALARLWFGLTLLALAFGRGPVLAADEKEAVKKSADSYLSAQRKINVTRFDRPRRDRTRRS